jgi:DNA-binding HxlR family transcriptional regulator
MSSPPDVHPSGESGASGASGAFGEYCPFTKAVEHLGDRWSLVIVQLLARHGPQGFNALVDGLPGVSRSVLARRLRALEALGLLARAPLPGRPAREAPYVLAPAGEQLVPTLKSLLRWAERWVPEDPALAQRDPAVLVWWLAQRLDPATAPEGPVVIAFDISGPRPQWVWLVLERGAPPSGCLEDPGLALQRYVYVEASGEALHPIARGRRAWADALADGSVRLYGEPALVRALPGWFRPPQAGVPAGPRPAARRPVQLPA